MDNVREVEQLACGLFCKTFGYAPHWLTSAPGRINLIGEFTDFNSGFVLPMAIEQRTAIAAAPNELNETILRSEAHDACAAAIRTWHRDDLKSTNAIILKVAL